MALGPLNRADLILRMTISDNPQERHAAADALYRLWRSSGIHPSEVEIVRRDGGPALERYTLAEGGMVWLELPKGVTVGVFNGFVVAYRDDKPIGDIFF